MHFILSCLLINLVKLYKIHKFLYIFFGVINKELTSNFYIKLVIFYIFFNYKLINITPFNLYKFYFFIMFL